MCYEKFFDSVQIHNKRCGLTVESFLLRIGDKSNNWNPWKTMYSLFGYWIIKSLCEDFAKVCALLIIGDYVTFANWGTTTKKTKKDVFIVLLFCFFLLLWHLCLHRPIPYLSSPARRVAAFQMASAKTFNVFFCSNKGSIQSVHHSESLYTSTT